MTPPLERLASTLFLSTASKLITLHMLFALISLRYRSLHDAPFIWDEMTNCSCRRPRPRGPLRDWILSPPQWAELGSTANLTFHRQPLRRGYYIKMTFQWGESAPCLHPDVLLNLSEVLGGEYGAEAEVVSGMCTQYRFVLLHFIFFLSFQGAKFWEGTLRKL